MFAISFAASGRTLALDVPRTCVLARASIFLCTDAIIAPCKADLGLPIVVLSCAFAVTFRCDGNIGKSWNMIFENLFPVFGVLPAPDRVAD